MKWNDISRIEGRNCFRKEEFERTKKYHRCLNDMEANGVRNFRNIKLCTHMPGRQREASMATKEIWTGTDLQRKKPRS